MPELLENIDIYLGMHSSEFDMIHWSSSEKTAAWIFLLEYVSKAFPMRLS